MSKIARVENHAGLRVQDGRIWGGGVCWLTMVMASSCFATHTAWFFHTVKPRMQPVCMLTFAPFQSVTCKLQDWKMRFNTC